MKELLKLLSIVDADGRSLMYFVYRMLEDEKNNIKTACNRKETVF